MQTHFHTGSAMGDIKTFGAGIIAFGADYLGWVPDVLKIIILCATCVYVVYRMMNEMRKWYSARPKSGDING